MAHALFVQPVSQGKQVGTHRPEHPNLLAGLLASAWHDDAGRDGPLVNVETSAAFVEHLHDRLPPA
jgi:hypothetical protein